jgi:hypothetical protein
MRQCSLGLGMRVPRTGDCSKSDEHLATAAALYRDTDMGLAGEAASGETR